MFQVRNLSKSYATHSVLSNVSFVINSGEHVALIGPNGSGKSTLLRCATGLEQPDSGSIVLLPTGAAIGYLPQSLADPGSSTVGEIVAAANGEFSAAERDLQAAAEALTTATDLDAAMEAYTQAMQRFDATGGYEREHRAASVLQGLGLGEISLDTPASTLSGGQKTRLGLATLLLSEPSLLLLDEPTNHLDVAALEWLEGFVTGYPGSVLIVSHDREFLDRTVTRVLFLDPETRSVRSYPGNYTTFEEAREQEHAHHVEQWKRQQEYVEKVERNINRLSSEALSIEKSTTPRQPGLRKYARKKAAVAKSRERKLERYMQSDERVDKPRPSWWLKLDFGPAHEGGKSVVRFNNLSFAYPGGQFLISDFTMEIGYGERVALVGPNGAGKTTLLRLIDGTLQPNSGSVKLGANVRVGRLAQEGETLNQDWTLLKTVLYERPMDETEARNFLHFFLFSADDVFRKVEECSLGERTRLQLALLVLRGCNLLLLDEPLNHLDIDGREHFEEALEAFVGTVIVVAHDRAFLHAYPNRIVEVKNGSARAYEGEYSDYLEWTAAR